MDVGVWLRSLGLSRYEAAFSDNSIDADVLPDLTDGDLAQLGVNLGDRKRLLKAIASLASNEPPAPAGKPAPAREQSGRPSAPPGDAAERRPITVMFCDLVGSTEPCGAARRRGLAQSRRRLSRRSLGGGDRAWRPCAEKARRRADGAVRLSAGAGERRRARGARRARHPARARRTQRQERRQRRARARRAHRPRIRAGGGRRDRRSVRRRAQCRRARAGRRRAGRRSSSPRPCSGRPPGCSSPRTAARTSSRACRRR